MPPMTILVIKYCMGLEDCVIYFLRDLFHGLPKKLDYVDNMTCLGVTLDGKLNWNKHINNKDDQAKIHAVKTNIGRTRGPTWRRCYGSGPHYRD